MITVGCRGRPCAFEPGGEHCDQRDEDQGVEKDDEELEDSIKSKSVMLEQTCGNLGFAAVEDVIELHIDADTKTSQLLRSFALTTEPRWKQVGPLGCTRH